MMTRHAPMTLLLVIGLMLLTIGPSLAVTLPASDWQQRFRAYDADKNGCIDQREFQQWMTEAFYFRDTERKGYLTADDLRGVLAPRTIGALTHNSGKLTLPEFLEAASKDFAAADVNKNGCLTMQEIAAYTHLASR